MSIWLFILCAVLIVILLVALSAAVVYQSRLAVCGSGKNPWCFKDWQCLNPEIGTPYVVNTPQTLRDNCSPITAERAAALNAQGKRNIAPGPDCPTCANCPRVLTDCPAYKAGDIDWTTCVPAVGYTPL